MKLFYETFILKNLQAELPIIFLIENERDEKLPIK